MSWLRRQLLLLFAAVQFLTRAPTPRLEGFQPDWPARAARFFPLVGQVVGLLSAGVWLVADRVWTPAIAAILAVAASVLATGGFHEDGLADTVDGLFGGSDRTRRLAIMKDSRLGAFGALALIAVLAIRTASLARLSPWRGALALVLAHGAGRAAAVVVMAVTPYAGEAASAKGRAAELRPTWAEAAFAAVWGFAPLSRLPPSQAAVAMLLALSAGFALTTAGRRLVGGHTGDVLGAVEQLCEAAVLLGASASL